MTPIFQHALLPHVQVEKQSKSVAGSEQKYRAPVFQTDHLEAPHKSSRELRGRGRPQRQRGRRDRWPLLEQPARIEMTPPGGTKGKGREAAECYAEQSEKLGPALSYRTAAVNDKSLLVLRSLGG